MKIDRGEYLGLLGANGSGKSTLLSCINGLLTPPSGTVQIFDRSGRSFDPAQPADLERIRRITGTLMQNPDDQIVGTTVEDDVGFGPQNLELDEQKIQQRVDHALALVQLESFKNRAPHQLSGGERQRLALAGVLALESDCLLLDEALSMIDPAHRSDFLDILDRLNSAGTTIIHATHSLEEAFRCQRCIVLERGQVLFDGTPAQLITNPDLEQWAFSIPESIKTIRLIKKQFPDREIHSLNPEEIAKVGGKLFRSRRDQPGSGTKNDAFPPASKACGFSVTPLAPSVSFAKVSYHYPESEAGLSAINVAIPAGSSVALIGPSGSGKSTFLYHINALLLPSSGVVQVNAQATTDKNVPLFRIRRGAALAIQQPERALCEYYVADDVALGPRGVGIRGEALKECVRSAMEACGLPFDEFADRPTAALSGGEKRKVALAGALALKSRILLLDEPTSALDGRSSVQILRLIQAQCATGQTIIATTHDIEFATHFDFIGVLDRGRLLAFGSPESVFGDSAWDLELPWTVAAARAAGLAAVPLSAEALLAAFSDQEIPEFSLSEAKNFQNVPVEVITKIRRKTGLEWFHTSRFGAFQPGDSVFHRFSPGKKLGFLLLCATIALMLPWPAATFGCTAGILLAGIFAAKVPGCRLIRPLITAAPFLGILVLFQALFSWAGDNSRILCTVWRFSLTETELLHSLSLIGRFFALATLLSLYTAVTTLHESLHAVQTSLKIFSRFGIPVRDISLALGIAFRFVPVLIEEAANIVSAHLSRGINRSRLRSALSLIIPLFIRSLERSVRLTNAILLRLYRTGK
ncbi:hypothetical protein FACS1894172_13000 [Spirochaetia bacterium]|nr:hypothetical protein FACS1894164_11830 [Spirochaetia bacterium]GHU33785.1 hypothetical protein FACS1894172_13000 [Spirochaetia bacterium]